MGSARSLATGTGLILIRIPSSCLHHPVSHLTLILVDSDSKFEYSREKQCPEKDQRRQRSPDLTSSHSSVRSRSRNSRKHLVSSMSTKTASSLPMTSKLPLKILDVQSQMLKQTTLLVRPQDLSTSLRWSH